MQRTFLVFALVGSLLLLIPMKTQAADDSEFLIISRSSAVLASETGWNAERFAIGFRALSNGTDVPKVSFHGTAGTLVVHRYEQSWASADTTPGNSIVANLKPEPSVETHEFRNVTFSYASRSPLASIVIAGSEARIDSKGTDLTIRGTANDPTVSGHPSTARYGQQFNPDERGQWIESGSFLSIRHQGLTGSLDGPTRFQWSMGSIRVTSSNQTIQFDSVAWNETESPTGGARVRKVIWHVAESKDAFGSFAIPVPGPESNSVMFAKELSTKNLSTISLDSYISIKGPLPSSSNQTGPSLWIRGPVEATVAASEEPSERHTYVVSIAGKPAAYSVGGGNIIALAGGSLVLAPTLPFVLVVAYFLREMLIHNVFRPLLVLYSHLTRPELLTSKIRNEILQTIAANNGIGFLELRKLLPMGRSGKPIAFGLLLHHLKKLEDFELITTRKAGRYRRYFDASKGIPASYSAIAHLRNQSAARVGREILNDPGLSHNDLMRRIGTTGFLSRSTLIYHASKLVGHGLVVRESTGGKTHYRPSLLLLSLREYVEPIDRLATPMQGVPANSALHSAASP